MLTIKYGASSRKKISFEFQWPVVKTKMAERLSKFIKHDFPNQFCWSGVRVTSQTGTYLHNIIFSVRNPLSGNYWWGLISHPAFTFPQSLLRFSCSMAQEVCISCSGDAFLFNGLIGKSNNSIYYLKTVLAPILSAVCIFQSTQGGHVLQAVNGENKQILTCDFSFRNYINPIKVFIKSIHFWKGKSIHF